MKKLAPVSLAALLLAGCYNPIPMPTVQGPSLEKAEAAILFYAILSSNGRYSHDFELDEKSFDADAIKEIEEDSGIILPPDARGLNFYYKAPIDPAFIAKIEISAKSKDEMLERISLIGNNIVMPFVGWPPERSWWTPRRGEVLIERQLEIDEIRLRAFLTDEDGRIFLYLDWAVI